MAVITHSLSLSLYIYVLSRNRRWELTAVVGLQRWYGGGVAVVRWYGGGIAAVVARWWIAVVRDRECEIRERELGRMRVNEIGGEGVIYIRTLGDVVN